MKKSVYILFILFTSLSLPTRSHEKTHCQIDDRPYHNMATNWVHTHIVDHKNNLLIYPKEAQLIANVIYFSFKRSHCTLIAQETALTSINILWKGWQNIAQTRLNPSKEAPYRITEYEKHHILDQLWPQHDQHQYIGKTYAQTVEYVVNGDYLLTVNAKNCVKQMRNQARAIVAQAITNAKEYIGQLFYTHKKYPKNYKGFDFLDYLWDYIPKLALGSFIQANNANDLVSEESWNILMKIQDISKKTWHMIEQERAGFYLALYKAMWHKMKHLNLEEEYFTIAFDNNGPLPINLQHEGLPKPEPINTYNSTVYLIE